MGATSLTGAGAILCAAHQGRDGRMHGHTWEVVAWVNDGRDALALQEYLNAVLVDYNHRTLPDNLAWGENLAARIGKQIRGCVAVDVSRPAERLFARWER